MRKFLVRVGLATVITMFIYFIASGSGMPDIISDQLNSKDKSSQSNVFTQLRDNVLGSFSFSSTTDDSIIGSGISLESTTTKPTGKKGDDPLSNLLQRFSGEKENPESEEKQNKNKESVDANKSTSTEENGLTPDEVINEKSNLPEFNSVCFPNLKRVCTEDGCEERSPGASFTLINENQNIIHRCKTEECNAYEINITKSGNSKNYRIKSKDNYVLGKETSDTDGGQSKYVELETQGITIIIQHGSCLER